MTSRKGVRAVDATSSFTPGALEDVTERQVILPKLVRKAVAYFAGSLGD